MKSHLKIFLSSLVFLAIGFTLNRYINLDLSPELIAQAEAISYIVTMVGIVISFGWYKRKAIPLDAEPTEMTDEHKPLQSKVFNSLLLINCINALVFIVTVDYSIRMMAAMSLLVVLITPFIFRTMHEK